MKWQVPAHTLGAGEGDVVGEVVLCARNACTSEDLYALVIAGISWIIAGLCVLRVRAEKVI